MKILEYVVAEIAISKTVALKQITQIDKLK